ncbi:MAG: ABC transporter substrate-binding protein, partial [Campylobacterota bacterium]|nr:ABC transporter substrate-binding protein [Campylobacterota bacterium]
YVQMDAVSSKEAQKDLEFFFNILKQNNSKSIGGKLPDDGFYY